MGLLPGVIVPVFIEFTELIFRHLNFKLFLSVGCEAKSFYLLRDSCFPEHNIFARILLRIVVPFRFLIRTNLIKTFRLKFNKLRKKV